MQLFFNTPLAPPDPILGFNAAFKKDPRAPQDKHNLGVGAYKTDSGQPLTLSAVQKAEEEILKEGCPKSYLPIDGDPLYIQEALKLLFGKELAPLKEKIYAAQTPGATGALAIAMRFLVQRGCKEIYLSNPTWANHKLIASQASMKVRSYTYYSPEKKGLDFEGMLKSIEAIPKGSAILLHGCCHNPTGCDPTKEQWKVISDLIKEKGIFPLIDFAYQGFGEGLEEDAFAPRLFAQEHQEMMLCDSFSKNLGLYGERLGLLAVRCADSDTAVRVGSQVKPIIRSLYSNPPCHPSLIARKVLESPELKKEWEAELTQMRERIQKMARELAKVFAPPSQEVSPSSPNQKGMFFFSGLSEEQVKQLREEFGIYILPNGRISVAGVNSGNLETITRAIRSVME